MESFSWIRRLHVVELDSSKRPRPSAYARAPNNVSSVSLEGLFQDHQQICFPLHLSRLQAMLWKTEYTETDHNKRVSYWERALGVFIEMSRVKPDELLISRPRKAAAGVRRDPLRRANEMFLELLRSSQIKGYFIGQNILIISHCVIFTFSSRERKSLLFNHDYFPYFKK